ncbi:MAG: hypothetical protein JNJ45_11015 [Chthonomonas sp.]|nr:hypothetical protein [Chthonomonas sp.]
MICSEYLAWEGALRLSTNLVHPEWGGAFSLWAARICHTRAGTGPCGVLRITRDGEPRAVVCAPDPKIAKAVQDAFGLSSYEVTLGLLQFGEGALPATAGILLEGLSVRVSLGAPGAAKPAQSTTGWGQQSLEILHEQAAIVVKKVLIPSDASTTAAISLSGFAVAPAKAA